MKFESRYTTQSKAKWNIQCILYIQSSCLIHGHCTERTFHFVLQCNFHDYLKHCLLNLLALWRLMPSNICSSQLQLIMETVIFNLIQAFSIARAFLTLCCIQGFKDTTSPSSFTISFIFCFQKLHIPLPFSEWETKLCVASYFFNNNFLLLFRKVIVYKTNLLQVIMSTIWHW